MNKKIIIFIGIILFLVLVTCGIVSTAGIVYVMNGITGPTQCTKVIDGKIYIDIKGSTDMVEVYGADPDSYKQIGGAECSSTIEDLLVVGKDNDSIFINESDVPNFYPEDFEYLDLTYLFYVYSSKNAVYVLDLDNKTFVETKLNPKTTTSAGGNYIKDEEFVYYSSFELSDASPKDFTGEEFLFSNVYNFGWDSKSVYYGATKISLIEDPKSFVVMSEFYLKDSKNVYFFNSDLAIESFSIVSGADPKTFLISKNALPYGRDKNSIYYFDSAVQTDSLDIEPINEYFWSNNKTLYFQDQEVIGFDPTTFQVSISNPKSGTDTSTGREYIGISRY